MLNKLTTQSLTTMVRLALLGLCLLSGGQALAQGGQPTLPIVELTLGDKSLMVEVASTGEQRYNGLSFRTKLAEDAGMLFVYQQPRKLTFTMRNTLLPLSIAYIDENLVIDEILEMDVGPGQLFPSRSIVKFALEVNQGWFERNNIGVGTRIQLK